MDRNDTDKIKILVVDDHDGILFSVEMGLKNEGFEVYVAEDTEVACRILDNFKVDIVLSDIHMPGLNGLEFINLINDAHVAIVPIAMSGGLMQAEALKAGYRGFLQKPFNTMDLLIEIDRVRMTN